MARLIWLINKLYQADQHALFATDCLYLIITIPFISSLYKDMKRHCIIESGVHFKSWNFALLINDGCKGSGIPMLLNNWRCPCAYNNFPFQIFVLFFIFYFFSTNQINIKKKYIGSIILSRAKTGNEQNTLMSA